MNAHWYRFLDSDGWVITPPASAEVGALRPEEEAQQALPSVPNQPQIGYIVRKDAAGAEAMDEVFAMPIVSTESGNVIAVLALGFKPVEELAVTSERNRVHRKRVEAELETTSERTATCGAVFRGRFASTQDAGHGLARGSG